jgi:pSer/pThr/pTyr-binding forkhead associated (FHA) protein
VITCPKCSKDNQDHYKFCLGCGAELPRGPAPKPFSPQTPPHGMRAAAAAAAAGVAAPQPAAALGGTVAAPQAALGLGGTVAIAAPAAPQPAAARAMGSAATVAAPMAPIAQAAPMPLPVAAPAPPPAPPVPVVPSLSLPPIGPTPPPPGIAPAPSAATVICPQCGHINSPSNLFCGSCGFRLGSGVPRAAPAPTATPGDSLPGAMVLTALRADGSEAGTYQLATGNGMVGRETGSIFAGDSYLSPRHASFRSTGPGRSSVKDEGSLNGVYKRLARDVPTELKSNDIFRIGQEIIQFEALTNQGPTADGVERLGAPSKGYIGRIALVIGREETGNAFPVPESGVHLGRERGDILFPEDGYVSGLHCRLSWDGRKLFLTDLGSSNGTFLRVLETEIRSGDVLLMGQQLFRIAL